VGTADNKVKQKVPVIAIFSLCAALYLVLLLYVKRVVGDDLNFPAMINQMSFAQWISHRYLTHSGRILGPEAFFYCFAKLPLFVWKIVNAANCFASPRLRPFYG
jgi:hypothetical protein